jgi:hypothetical protein
MLCETCQHRSLVALVLFPPLAFYCFSVHGARFKELITCWQTAELNNAQRRVALAEMIMAVH